MTHTQKKLKVIYFLTSAIDKLKGTCYEHDLHKMRNKYIYKDITPNELSTDLRWLKDIKEIIKING